MASHFTAQMALPGQQYGIKAPQPLYPVTFHRNPTKGTTLWQDKGLGLPGHVTRCVLYVEPA
ncbi:hypothetical protein [Pantanalinema rosaneae]|uniref:hypothetical protein n=1 Tax=Pantanalinema rosaneae TaxID=1620701 RepID=UPI003D6E2961